MLLLFAAKGVCPKGVWPKGVWPKGVWPRCGRHPGPVESDDSKFWENTDDCTTAGTEGRC